MTNPEVPSPELSTTDVPPPFTGPAEDYDRFMGRYTPSLAAALADAAGVRSGMRVADVGCGPGGLTRVLADRVGAPNVGAVDPAPQFVEACRARVRGADVRRGVAEELPWPDGAFDASLSCLVVAFMRDPARGIAQMRRVTRAGGTVAACMWDMAGGGMPMLCTFAAALRSVAPDAPGGRPLAGTAEGDLVTLLAGAGLDDVTGGALTAHADYTGFDDFWEPLTLGVGPTGRHLASLPAARQAEVREACRARMPEGPFRLDARAWYARGTVPG